MMEKANNMGVLSAFSSATNDRLSSLGTFGLADEDKILAIRKMVSGGAINTRKNIHSGMGRM